MKNSDQSLESGKDEFEFYSCETGATIGLQSPFSTPLPFPIPKEIDYNLGTSTSFLSQKLAHLERVKLDCCLTVTLEHRDFLLHPDEK